MGPCWSAESVLHPEVSGAGSGGTAWHCQEQHTHAHTRLHGSSWLLFSALWNMEMGSPEALLRSLSSQQAQENCCALCPSLDLARNTMIVGCRFKQQGRMCRQRQGEGSQPVEGLPLHTVGGLPVRTTNNQPVAAAASAEGVGDSSTRGLTGCCCGLLLLSSGLSNSLAVAICVMGWQVAPLPQLEVANNR